MGSVASSICKGLRSIVRAVVPVLLRSHPSLASRLHVPPACWARLVSVAPCPPLQVVSKVLPIVRVLTSASPIGLLVNTTLLAVQHLCPKASPYVGVVLTLGAGQATVEQALRQTAVAVASEADPRLGAALGLMDSAAGSPANDTMDFDAMGLPSGGSMVCVLPSSQVLGNVTRVLVLARQEDAAELLGGLTALRQDLPELVQAGRLLSSQNPTIAQEDGALLSVLTSRLLAAASRHFQPCMPAI